MAKTEQKEEGIVETIKTVVYALLIAGLFRSLFFQPFWIPSGSMKDTLLIGDFLFVNKMAYGYSRYSCPFAMCPISGRLFGSEPERGDVVVFRHPTAGTDYIKRVIGLPGDIVQLRDGVVYINNEASERIPQPDFIETFAPQGSQRNPPGCKNRPVSLGEECIKERYTEVLPGGFSHSILEFRNSPDDNTPAYRVPEGEYFFVGDNRDNSADSRIPRSRGGVGFVPYENLIGRADRVILSSAGARIIYFWTWRSDRFFKRIE